MVEEIKEGFRVVNRNLPLILIQIGGTVISFIAFILFIGIPIGIAVIYLGIDILRLKETLTILKDPVRFLSQHSGLAFFLAISFILYLTAVTCLALFIFGGSMAIIKDSIRYPSERFSFRKFISEGKRFFLPLCLLVIILSLFFLIFTFILGALAGTSLVLLTSYKDDMGIFLIVLSVISALILIGITFIGFLLLLSLSIYAVIALIVEELRAWKAIKRAIRFMRENLLEATAFYLLLIAGYIGIVVLMIIMNLPLSMIPIIGSIFTIPYQIVSYLIQLYLGIVIISALIVFYMRRRVENN